MDPYPYVSDFQDSCFQKSDVLYLIIYFIVLKADQWRKHKKDSQNTLIKMTQSLKLALKVFSVVSVTFMNHLMVF